MHHSPFAVRCSLAMRALLLALACLGACTSGPAPTAAAPSKASTEPGRSPAPAAEPDVADPSATAPAEPAPTEPAAADRCNPLPRVGDPCGPDDSWCVESWGDPGGWSSALWCRDGRWKREQERNLAEDAP